AESGRGPTLGESATRQSPGLGFRRNPSELQRFLQRSELNRAVSAVRRAIRSIPGEDIMVLGFSRAWRTFCAQADVSCKNAPRLMRKLAELKAGWAGSAGGRGMGRITGCASAFAE